MDLMIEVVRGAHWRPIRRRAAYLTFDTLLGADLALLRAIADGEAVARVVRGEEVVHIACRKPDGSALVVGCVSAPGTWMAMEAPLTPRQVGQGREKQP